MYDEILSKIKNMQNLSPLLLLDEAALFFKENYKGKVYSCVPKDPYKTNEIMVFEICSFLSNTDILDSNNLIIILAEDTKIDNKVLSKVKYVMKKSNKIISKLINAKEALDILKEDNNLSYNKFCVLNSPELYYLKNKFNSNRYIELFSGEK